MEFYVIESEYNINLDYLSMLSFTISSFIIFQQNNITTSNVTFILDQNTVIINKTNDNHKSALILVFGCNNRIVYSDSTTLLTKSIYSHNFNRPNIANYHGIVGLAHGYNYKFITDDMHINKITKKNNTCMVGKVLYYHQFSILLFMVFSTIFFGMPLTYIIINICIAINIYI